MGTKILNSRWFYVVLSILLAFLLWVYVGNDPNSVDTGTLRNVRVVFSGLEKLEERGLMISEGAEQTVNLQLSARGEVWSRLNQGDTTVVVDVSGITEPGEQSVAITSRNINFPRSITIIDSIDVRYTSPSTIDFTVSRWSSKEIPVQGTFNGSVAEGFQRRDFSFAPDTITVSGQEELVSQVDHAQITISQKDMNSTYSADCSYTLIGTNGQPIAAGLVETEPETVLVTLPVEKMKEVELTVDLIPGGGATADNVTVDIEPRTLMVAGSAEILDQLDRISLGEIDLSKVFGTLTQSMTINLDPSLTNVSGTTEAKVTVTVEGLVTKTLEAGNIEIINKPSGYEITRNTQSCTVLIRGTQEAVDAVTASQVRIVADLSNLDLSTGSRTVPVKVYLDGSSEVGVVGEYNISISVSRS